MKPACMNLLLALFLISNFAFASDPVPDCIGDDGSTIPVINQQVLYWKQNTANEYLARAHVQGQIVKLLPNETGHNHFEIQIGTDSSDILEVIYDYEFGKLPKLAVGDMIEACGDYITSYAEGNGYKPSPAGALIHWIHISDEPDKHASGYTMVNGSVYGQDLPQKRR
jgi:hypothetical protein